MHLFNKKFDPQVLTEIQEVNRVAAAERFKATQVKGNTALVPNGKKVAEQLDAVATLIEQYRDDLVAQRLKEAGVPTGTKTQINLQTGGIYELP